MPLILSQCHSALSEVVWEEVLCIFVVKLMSQTGDVRILQAVASTYRQCGVDTGVFFRPSRNMPAETPTLPDV